MGLKIIAGRGKTGKSTYIYDEIIREINRCTEDNLLLIVPEQITYQSEYDIVNRINGSGIMDLNIMSFKRLAYKVFEEVGGIKIQEINDYGKIMLLKQIFEENFDDLTVFKKASRQDGFLKEFNSLIKELKQNIISVDFLENIADYKLPGSENQLLNKKLRDIIKIYKEINNRTKDKFYDEEDKTDLFISSISKSHFLKNSKVWIDGFENFNQQIYRLIAELIKYCKDVVMSFNIDARCLKNPLAAGDWEVFKIISDSYKSITDNLPESPEIVILTENRLKEEICILEKNLFAIDENYLNKNIENIQIYSSVNPYTETEMAAGKIISLVRDDGYRWRDIRVAVGLMDDYGLNIKKVFTQYKIPFFLDVKRNIMENPLTKFILSLLDMFIYNFKHDNVFEYLKTGFSFLNYDEVDRMENFALKYGIQGERWFKPFEFKGENNVYFNKLREKFTSDLSGFRKIFNKLKTTDDITKFVFNFLKINKVQEKVEKQVNLLKRNGFYEISSENAQVWNYVMDIFEQINLAGAAQTVITPLEYRKMIEAGFKEIGISIIPPSLDVVTVGEIDKISLGSSKILFILGANEGRLESSNVENGLLFDDERDYLTQTGVKLSNNSVYQMYKEKHILYNTFISASDKIFVSYSFGTNDGKTLQPSVMINRIKQIFPMIKENSDLTNTDEIFKVSNAGGTVDFLITNLRDFLDGRSIDTIWKDVYSWYSENELDIFEAIKLGINYDNKAEKISKENLMKIYEMPVIMSVSKLESFADCPFKFFMENIIKPEPRTIQKVEFYDLGNIYHKAIEKFTKELSQEDINVDFLDKDFVYNMANSCAEKILTEKEWEYTALDANERNKYLKEKIKRLIKRAAYTIIQQLKAGSFRPAFTELSIGLNDSNIFVPPMEININDNFSIFLQGRIDRIDVLRKEDKAFINIIDYKSSYKEIDLSDAVNGLQLQLLIYMSAIIKNGQNIIKSGPEAGGMYYFCIDDPMIDGDSLGDSDAETEIFNKLSLKGFILEDSDVISNMDNKINETRTSGIIPVSFNKDGSTSKSSNTLTKDEFKAVLGRADEVAKNIAEEILEGIIDIYPYKKESGYKTPCTYCDYKSICQFDSSIEGNEYRAIKNKKKQEILFEIMNGKGGTVNGMEPKSKKDN